jgi:hypothetical protein
MPDQGLADTADVLGPCSPSLPSFERIGSIRRVIGIDTHRTFDEVVFWEEGRSAASQRALCPRGPRVPRTTGVSRIASAVRRLCASQPPRRGGAQEGIYLVCRIRMDCGMMSGIG